MKTITTALVATAAILIAGCQSNQTAAIHHPVATPSPPTTARPPMTYEQTYSQMSWEEVSRSDSMGAFAYYYKYHPNEHTEEVRALADKWLQDTVLNAVHQGKEVKHFFFRDPNIQVGTTWAVLGGQLDIGQVSLYSHPIDTLTVSVQQDLRGPLTQFIYIKGRGIGVSGNLVYCFGF